MTLFKRRDDGHARIELARIERYWRQANGGDAYLTAYETARTRSGSSDNILKQNRHYTLWQMVDRVVDEKLPGDIAECGCFKGHSTVMTAARLAERGWSGRFLVFDSFEGGLSDKVAADRTVRGDTGDEATRSQKLEFASSRDEVAALLAPYPFVSLHAGWIPQVFDATPELADRRFALVHLDVDLYEPTRDSLACFAPRMVDGGVFVIDDYGSAHFPGCKAAVDEFRASHRVRFFLESHLIGAVLVV